MIRRKWSMADILCVNFNFITLSISSLYSLLLFNLSFLRNWFFQPFFSLFHSTYHSLKFPEFNYVKTKEFILFSFKFCFSSLPLEYLILSFFSLQNNTLLLLTTTCFDKYLNKSHLITHLRFCSFNLHRIIDSKSQRIFES